MNLYTQRLLGYICLSLFLAFVAGPYTAQRMVSQTEPVVYLSTIALSSSTQRPACSENVVNISEKDLASFPMVQKAVLSLSRSPIETNQMSLFGGNLGAFVKRALGRSQRAFCFEYRERTFKLVWLIIRDIGTLYLVGINEPPSVPSLAESALSRYPVLAAYIDHLKQAAQTSKSLQAKEKTKSTVAPALDTGKTVDDAIKRFEKIRRQAERRISMPSTIDGSAFYERKRTKLGEDEWASLTRALGADQEGGVFRIGHYLIIGQSEVLPESVPENLKWFTVFRYILAGVFLCFGFLAMKGIY